MRRVYHCALGWDGIPLAPARGEQTLGQAVGFRPFAAGIRQQFSERGLGRDGIGERLEAHVGRTWGAIGVTGCPRRAGLVACHRQSHGRKPSEVHLCRWPPAGSAGWLRQQGAPGPYDGGHGGVRIRERQGASRRRRGVELFWSRLQRRRYGTFHLLSSQRPAPSPRRERFRRSSTTSAISTRSTRRR